MEVTPLDRELTDGTVTLRPSTPADVEVLIAGRDAEFHRFLGAGSPEPEPAAVVLNAERQVVGWIDYDVNRAWLAPGEVNIGYNVFPQYRGLGYAGRSLELLIRFLAEDADCTAATLLIDPANAPSIAVAERAGFTRQRDIDDQILYRHPSHPSKPEEH